MQNQAAGVPHISRLSERRRTPRLHDGERTPGQVAVVTCFINYNEPGALNTWSPFLKRDNRFARERVLPSCRSRAIGNSQVSKAGVSHSCSAGARGYPDPHPACLLPPDVQTGTAADDVPRDMTYWRVRCDVWSRSRYLVARASGLSSSSSKG